MPLHTFCLDVLHWVSHVHPRANTRRWPVGKIAASVTVDRVVLSGTKSRGRKRNAGALDVSRLPPSTRRRLNDVLAATEEATWLTKAPCVRSLDDAKSLAPLWASALANLQDKARCAAVPVSLSSHDDRMLQYGRDVPTCSLGPEGCAATTFPGNMGPLPIYVMPSVQELIDRGEPPPHAFSSNATCLLCIRRDCHASTLAWQSMVTNPTHQILRGSICPPPFANLVDVPGGYHTSAMCSLPVDGGNKSVFGPHAIVGIHGKLVPRINPETKQWFFDQSAIKVRNPSFLCQGAQASTS